LDGYDLVFRYYEMLILSKLDKLICILGDSHYSVLQSFHCCSSQFHSFFS
jgi:hypothetical protein